MKRLMIVLAVLALVSSFLPKVYADGNTASLNLQVTFAPSELLRIWSEPAGPFSVKEGELLEFAVIAEDMDTINVELGVEGLPRGAEFIMDPVQPRSSHRREGKFRWMPKIGQAIVAGEIHNMPPAPYLASFIARNIEGETANLHVPISVVQGERIISIEVNEANWILEGVKLGEKRSNFGADGQPIHKIKNTGNIPVVVDMAYVLPEAVNTYMVLPRLEQGLNTFITIVGDTVLPPDQRIKLNRVINPGMEEPLPLTYGAPTELREGVTDMSMQYEIRAYDARGQFVGPV